MTPGSSEDIAARIERLPVAGWHHRVRAVVSIAHFFDAFDALAIASVMPALVPLWHLSPASVGVMISTGYLGQAIGSVFFGMLAQRIGRVPVTLATVLIFAGMSLACAFSTGFAMLLAFRFLQGIGLGGEQPVMHAYMNEIAKAKGRARFILLPSLGFSFGVAAAAFAGRWIIPHFGWQAMFLIGVLPAIVTLPLRAMLPESPRWLAAVAKPERADAEMQRIEAAVSDNGRRPLPPSMPIAVSVAAGEATIGGLFRGPYLRRTLVVWTIFFSAYFVSYGLTNWMPTIYRTVYGLSLQQALTFGAATTASSLIGSIAVTFLIDTVGRKRWFGFSLIATALPMIVLGLLATRDASIVLLLVSIAALLVNPVCIAIGVYAAENYPTHLRAIGTGIGSAWIRIGAVIAPLLIGWLIPSFGIVSVFAMFAIVAAVGGVATLLFAIETSGRTLESLNPMSSDCSGATA